MVFGRQKAILRSHKDRAYRHNMWRLLWVTPVIILVFAVTTLFGNGHNKSMQGQQSFQLASVSGQSTGTLTQQQLSTSNSATLAAASTDPGVLDNCVYQGGPRNGEKCSKTPPPAFFAPVLCYYSHPSYKDPTNCRPYEDTTSIGAFLDSTGNTYCVFVAGAGQFQSYKKVQVSNFKQADEVPDCSVAYPA